ncbi:unnamed protein product [Prunus armeniaca]|uniref:Uncharacterized protein n=1 Tax=Prunus armeniaca TaxID=36596 RepID=A0A6J5UAR3_PRUAR|nr:unnamed protein product [Prunus armeniaca]
MEAQGRWRTQGARWTEQRDRDGALGELSVLNGMTEMVISASSVDGEREMCFIDVRERVF